MSEIPIDRPEHKANVTLEDLAAQCHVWERFLKVLPNGSAGPDGGCSKTLETMIKNADWKEVYSICSKWHKAMEDIKTHHWGHLDEATKADLKFQYERATRNANDLDTAMKKAYDLAQACAVTEERTGSDEPFKFMAKEGSRPRLVQTWPLDAFRTEAHLCHDTFVSKIKAIVGRHIEMSEQRHKERAPITEGSSEGDMWTKIWAALPINTDADLPFHSIDEKLAAQPREWKSEWGISKRVSVAFAVQISHRWYDAMGEIEHHYRNFLDKVTLDTLAKAEECAKKFHHGLKRLKSEPRGVAKLDPSPIYKSLDTIRSKYQHWVRGLIKQRAQHQGPVTDSNHAKLTDLIRKHQHVLPEDEHIPLGH